MKGKITEKTPELNEKIVEMYKQGISRQKISIELHVATKYVSKYLDSLGFEKRETMRKYDYDAIVECYKECKNLRKTAKIFNTDQSEVAAIVKKYNIPIYHKKKKTCNFNIFDNIDTEEKAYWLGFFYADGSIGNGTRGRWTVELALKESDANHLYKFNKFIEGDDNIINKRTQTVKEKQYESCRWNVNDKHLCETLHKQGAVHNKTYGLNFPSEDIVPKHLLNHFIRGFFDGDGSIMTDTASNKKLGISIIGTKEMLDGIKNWLNLSNNLVVQKTKNTTVYHLRLKLAHSIKFCQKIYSDATIYLDRKYSKWDDFCRSNMKMLEGLRGEFGENWDVNTEVTKYLNYKKYCNA